MWAYRPMSVLDRETLVDGRYAVVASDLHYLDAVKLANGLNQGTVAPTTDEMSAMDMVRMEPLDRPSRNIERDAEYLH